MVSFMIFTASDWKLLDQPMYVNIHGVSYRRRLYLHIPCPDYPKSNSVTLDTIFCTQTHNSRENSYYALRMNIRSAGQEILGPCMELEGSLPCSKPGHWTDLHRNKN